MRQATLRDDVIISRMRKGFGYRLLSDLSCPPVSKCVSVQRCSLPGQSVFYSALTDDKRHLERERYLNLCECSSLAKEGVNSIGREYFTVSYWRIERPLKISSFITDKTFTDVTDNNILNYFRKEFSEHNNRYSKEQLELCEFLNEEFSKSVTNDFEYLITASIVDDVLNGCGFDGVIYPSVRTQGVGGVNLVLSSGVANQLAFDGLHETLFLKNANKSYLTITKALDENWKSRKIQSPNLNQILDDLGVSDIHDLQLRL